MSAAARERDENTEHTLIFVDMLGFGALTELFQRRVIEEGPDSEGFLSSATSPIQNRINRFYRVIDQLVFRQKLTGLEHAMLFSDCAFLDTGVASVAGHFATELMRELIKEHVPVRMGIGKGTFYPLGFSTELSDGMVSRSRFVGTAVVRAHAAEQCGGKGMRIFVHPSLEDERAAIQSNIQMLSLPKPLNGARWELDYLYPQGPALQERSIDKADRELFVAVAAMRDPNAPPRVRRHYVETLRAMNRMRKGRNRKHVRPRNVRYQIDGSGW